MHFNTLSYASIYLEPWGRNLRDGTEFKLGSGSGAVYKRPEGVYVVTAKHVVSGINPIDGKFLDKERFVPRRMVAVFADVDPNGPKDKFDSIEIDIPLLDEENNSLWIEHPDPLVDVAAVLIRNEDLPGSALIAPQDPDRRIREGDLEDPDWRENINNPNAGRPVPLRVPGQLYVIGFPFGARGTWPAAIWVTGHVASEPDVMYDGQAYFLLDARTREGLSGAPVVRHIPSGSTVQVDGEPVVTGADATEWVGVYSGRLNEDSDLGRVWHVSVVRDLLGAVDPGPLNTEF